MLKWSRSHFGFKIKKLLFLGVQNKYSSICVIAQGRGIWFSEVSHEVKLIGDGDSSVMATVRQSVPYGSHVEKIECAKYAVKCYRSQLEQLAKDNPQYRGKGGLTKQAIHRLTVGARIAIRMASKREMFSSYRMTSETGLVMCLGITATVIHLSVNISSLKHVKRERRKRKRKKRKRFMTEWTIRMLKTI